MKTIRGFAGLAFFLSAVAASQAAGAQDYPSKSITAVVFGAPGTTPDLFARAVARQMGAALGQTIVVKNAPGASGVIAAQEVIRAAPDGYTVLFTSNTSLVNTKYLLKNAPFDPLRDLTPIGATVEPIEMLLVRSDLPAKTLPELMAYAKKNPGKVSYGASSAGSIFHLNGENFAGAAGVQLLYVPYNGPVAALHDVAAGRVDMSFNSFGGLANMVASGRVRVMATLEGERYAGLPDVPAVAEVVPGYRKVDSWAALMGPAKLPQSIVSRLNAALADALRSPEMAKWMEENVVKPIGGPPEKVTELIKTSSVRIKTLIDEIGLQPQ